jgi:hypothetical protein
LYGLADWLKTGRGKTAHDPILLGLLNDPAREVKKQVIESLEIEKIRVPSPLCRKSFQIAHAANCIS